MSDERSAMTVGEFNALSELLAREDVFLFRSHEGDGEKAWAIFPWGMESHPVEAATAHEAYAKLFEGTSPITLLRDLKASDTPATHPPEPRDAE